MNRMSKYWLKDPEKHDFPAAAEYLDLLFYEKETGGMVEKLKDAKTIFRKAKEKMSPVLLVRHSSKLMVADGYHRLCAIYYLSEDEDIPCRVV